MSVKTEGYCRLHKKVLSYCKGMKLPLEKSELLITADGFYEKNVGLSAFLCTSLPELYVRVKAQEVLFP